MLTGKATLAGRTKIRSQALIHSNDQLVGPVAPHARPGTPTEAPNNIKIWNHGKQSLPLLSLGVNVPKLRMPSPTTLGKGVICWNLQWDIVPREMNCFTLQDEGELLGLHWDPLILLQAGPVKMH